MSFRWYNHYAFPWNCGSEPAWATKENTIPIQFIQFDHLGAQVSIVDFINSTIASIIPE